MGSPERPIRVLVVDDEEEIRRALKSVLAVRKFEVALACDGAEALDVAIDFEPDLVILDLSLPDMDGLDVCRELRSWLTAPVLVLSVRSGDEDKIGALDLGADDYLTKPFSTGELLARMRALLRRSESGESTPAELKVGELEVNEATREVFVRGEPVTLTRTEFDILDYLMRKAGQVVTWRMLIEHVWGPDYAGGGVTTDDTQSLRVHVSHLRRKIEANPSLPRYIITEPGVGFRLRAT